MKRKSPLWAKLVLSLLAIGVFAGAAFAQVATPGGTVISNKASATYTDDPLNPTKYASESNTVTTTVSYVAGLEITPDSTASTGSVAPGATATYTFAVKNLSNYTTNASFLASGGSVQLAGATGTTAVSAAFIDVDGDGTFNAGDVDINDATADLYSMLQGASVNVIVKVAVDAAAAGGGTLTVTLGDTTTGGPTFDNQAVDATTHNVATSSPSGITPVNGEREAKGTGIMTVSNVGLVTNGPNGQPGAIGPGPSNNTDYTNKAISPTATNTPVVFDNTVHNGGNAADTFKLTAPTVPAGSTVEISVDGGITWVTVATAGTPTATPSVDTTSVAASADFSYKVRVTLPATGVTPYTASSTTITATSNTTPTSSNNTIDRIYAGYLLLEKEATVSNTTGVGGVNDPVPGAEITYVITYTNVANAAVGSGNVNLDALSVVITEDGDVSPNNWAGTTNHVAVATPDSNGGVVVISASTGAVANGKYVDTVGTVAAGTNGTLTIKRVIK